MKQKRASIFVRIELTEFYYLLMLNMLNIFAIHTETILKDLYQYLMKHENAGKTAEPVLL